LVAMASNVTSVRAWLRTTQVSVTIANARNERTVESAGEFHCNTAAVCLRVRNAALGLHSKTLTNIAVITQSTDLFEVCTESLVHNALGTCEQTRQVN
jgi:hypothetical protein